MRRKGSLDHNVSQNKHVVYRYSPDCRRRVYVRKDCDRSTWPRLSTVERDSKLDLIGRIGP